MTVWFNILQRNLNAKCTSSFLSLWLLTLTFCEKAWMWSTTSLLSLQLSAMHWMHIVSFFFYFIPCNFLFCCNCWNVFKPFFAPCDFWCCFIVVVDNCSNTSCYSCWSIFPTCFSPYNFWCWFNCCYNRWLLQNLISCCHWLRQLLKHCSNSNVYNFNGGSNTSYDNTSTSTNKVSLQVKPFEFRCFFSFELHVYCIIRSMSMHFFKLK